MPVVKCLCGQMKYLVLRPEDAQKWGASLENLRVLGDLPAPRDDRMPVIVCHACGRWSWADGKLRDPEGRLSA